MDIGDSYNPRWFSNLFLKQSQAKLYYRKNPRPLTISNNAAFYAPDI